MIIILLIIMVIVSKLWQVGGFKKSKLKFWGNDRGQKNFPPGWQKSLLCILGEFLVNWTVYMLNNYFCILHHQTPWFFNVSQIGGMVTPSPFRSLWFHGVSGMFRCLIGASFRLLLCQFNSLVSSIIAHRLSWVLLELRPADLINRSQLEKNQNRKQGH